MPPPCTAAYDDLQKELFKVNSDFDWLDPLFHHFFVFPLLELKLATIGVSCSKAVPSQTLKTIINYN